MQPLPRDFLTQLAQNYNLTEEQQEAFVERFSSNKNLLEIAETLNITPNAFQTRMTGVYSKFSISGKGPGKVRQLHDFLIKKHQKSHASTITEPSHPAINTVKEATLEAYRNFAPLAGDPEIINLITQGEGHHLEFKSTARWNLRENKKDKAMEHEIVKTVAGFLNANGGILLIGVNDEGVLLGLNSDYKTLTKNSADKFKLFLNNDLLLQEIGKECGTLWQITVHQVSGFELCSVVVKPSPKPIYVKVKDKGGKEEDCFYIRSNNSTVKLNLKQAVEYAKARWK
ncbi:putative DNA binding domain-containing protein [Laspinema sp. D1]|uniref:DNA binding domain-containing protein n=1 Tax=Laspinema palackyanum D2a TaxID=2953684 RepID=A0ABT2MJQ2_9CYAN|nr:putative DNA binding domain-containing protein [Laspinema sp. D2a]